MPTTAERHALLFLAAIAVVGGTVRLHQSHVFASEVAQAFPDATPAALADRALTDQMAAVDSARTSARQRSRRPKTSSTATSASATGAPSRSGRARGPASEPKQRATPTPVTVPVNRASATDLEQLPGIGPALAQRVVTFRERNGPFRSMEDLLRVPGIGPAIAARIAASVTF